MAGDLVQDMEDAWVQVMDAAAEEVSAVAWGEVLDMVSTPIIINPRQKKGCEPRKNSWRICLMLLTSS